MTQYDYDNNSHHVLSWITREPEETLSLTFDACVLVPIRVSLVPIRVSYLALRYFFRLLLGRKRRSQLSFLQRFWINNNFFSPSFHMARVTNKFINKIRASKQPFLVKVTVPKEGYSYYCRIIDFSPGREEDIIKHFTPKEGNVVIDVGAHVGRYSIISSKLIGPNGRVVAIEAHPGNFQILKRNLQLNNLEDNVTPFNCAAYSKDNESLRLFLPKQDRGNTIYNTIMENRETTESFVSVPGSTLDSIVKRAGMDEEDVNWIKIDVEGAEYEVLKGAQNILSKSNDISILVEIHNLSTGNFYASIIDMLTNYNFVIVFEKIYDGGERHVILQKSKAIAERDRQQRQSLHQ